MRRPQRLNTKAWIGVALGLALFVPVAVTADADGSAVFRAQPVFARQPELMLAERAALVSKPGGMFGPTQATPATVWLQAQQRAVRQLREATRAVTRPTGPGDLCLAQMKAVLCPVMARIPVLRDVVGQMAMWGNFDCPTVTASTAAWPPMTVPEPSVAPR